MSNLQLRYYKKPRNKLNKKIFLILSFLKKRVFLVVLALIAVISLLTFVALPRLTTPVVNDVMINDDKEVFTQLISKTGPFYAEFDGKKVISNLIDKINYVNLGKIEKPTNVAIGPFQNFFLFQKTLNPVTTIIVNPKVNTNPNFKISVKDEQSTNMFSYEVETVNDDSEYTIFEGETIIYQKLASDNKCEKKSDTKTIYICKTMFGDSAKKVLDVSIKDKNNKKYEVIRNKVVNLNTTNKIICTFPQEAKAGNNSVGCTSPVDADIFIGDTSYKLTASKETIVNVDGKPGKNEFLMIGTDSNKQKIEQVVSFEVKNSFNFEITPIKDKFDIANPTRLEFKINSNEKLNIDITSNAKESTKGYESFNSNPIDTNFGIVNYINKDNKFDPSTSSLVFEIDTTSNNNSTKKTVFAPMINVDFVIKSESGKNITAVCKMYIKVNDQIQDKSICTVKINN
jgi:predicted DNA binding protein